MDYDSTYSKKLAARMRKHPPGLERGREKIKIAIEMANDEARRMLILKTMQVCGATPALLHVVSLGLLPLSDGKAALRLPPEQQDRIAAEAEQRHLAWLLNECGGSSALMRVVRGNKLDLGEAKLAALLPPDQQERVAAEVEQWHVRKRDEWEQEKRERDAAEADVGGVAQESWHEWYHEWRRKRDAAEAERSGVARESFHEWYQKLIERLAEEAGAGGVKAALKRAKLRLVESSS